MGYESKFIVAYIFELEMKDGKKWRDAVTIASIDLCKISGIFNLGIFDKELNATIDIDGESVEEDCYGEGLKYTDDFDAVINELKRYEEEEHYRRIAPAIGMLEGFRKVKDEFKNLVVIHYGH